MKFVRWHSKFVVTGNTIEPSDVRVRNLKEASLIQKNKPFI